MKVYQGQLNQERHWTEKQPLYTLCPGHGQTETHCTEPRKINNKQKKNKKQYKNCECINQKSWLTSQGMLLVHWMQFM
jgi:hypothetical protein